MPTFRTQADLVAWYDEHNDGFPNRERNQTSEHAVQWFVAYQESSVVGDWSQRDRTYAFFDGSGTTETKDNPEVVDEWLTNWHEFGSTDDELVKEMREFWDF
jgi:hypothetical protein